MPVRLARALRWLLPLPLILSVAAACHTTVAAPADSSALAPAINGTFVAWEDYRNSDTAGSDVYGRNMTSTPGPETLIAGGNGDQGAPAVSEQYVAWEDGGAIRAQSRSGGSVINVAGGNNNFDPAVCGSLVVWTVTASNGNGNIYGRDLSGGNAFPIAATATNSAYPDCDGNRVVYMCTSATTGADICMWDRTTGTTSVVSAQPWNEWIPAISGNIVVWQEWPNQPSCCVQIAGINLSTGQRISVAHGSGNQITPDVSGTLIVWEDDRGTTPQIWYLDLATGQEAAVDANSVTQEEPQVSGRNVVWQENSNSGNWAIALKTL